MNKTLLLVIGAIVVIGALFMFLGPKTSSQTGAKEKGAPTTSGSLKSLMAMQGAHVCMVQSTNEISTSAGTVYVADGVMRADFVTTASGKGDITSHIIVKDATGYVWSSVSPQGIKIPFDINKAEVANGDKSFDLNQTVQYSCNAWKVDQNLLVPPTNINFMDASAFMPKASSATGTSSATSTPTSASTSMKAQQCAACATLSGTQQSQCKAALGCK